MRLRKTYGRHIFRHPLNDFQFVLAQLEGNESFQKQAGALKDDSHR